MSARLPDGSTRRHNLESVEAQTGKRPRDLDGPECPAWGEHVWTWWCDLHAGRRAGAMGPAPLSYADIAAWAGLTHTQPRSVEVRLIMAIDAAWLEHATAAGKGGSA